MQAQARMWFQQAEHHFNRKENKRSTAAQPMKAKGQTAFEELRDAHETTVGAEIHEKALEKLSNFPEETSEKKQGKEIPLVSYYASLLKKESVTTEGV